MVFVDQDYMIIYGFYRVCFGLQVPSQKVEQGMELWWVWVIQWSNTLPSGDIMSTCDS